MSGFATGMRRVTKKIHLPCNQVGFPANLLEMSQEFLKDPPVPPVSRARTERIGPEGLAALMHAGQQGDQAAYRQLLLQVSGRMRGLVRARAPWMSDADVEDMVQDILLSLHRARASWDPARPFLPWLVTIARNRLADNARRYARRNSLDLATQEITETFCDVPTNGGAESVVNFLAVREVMKSLSPTERRAVELVRLREMSLAEAAEESGSTVAAMKVAVHRAMLKLRAALRAKE